MKISALPAVLAAAAASMPNVSAFGVTRSSPNGVAATKGQSHASPGSALYSTTADKDPFSIYNEDEVEAADADTRIPFFNTVSSVEPFNEAVNAPIARGIRLTGGEKLRQEGLTGKGIKVGVVDSGIDRDHPGFNGKVTRKQWYEEGDLASGRGGPHGTHVAGTIHMMAPEAEIFDYRVFDPSGRGSSLTIARAIYKAIEDGCDIINLSLGGEPGSSIAPWTRFVLDKAYDEGVLVVAAAGNSGDDNILTNEVSYPAAYPTTMSIGAVAKKDNLPSADFSSSNSEVDYAGIGVEVDSFYPGGFRVSFDGTSMACPHVCGLITALMTKGGKYSDIIRDDASCRKLLNDEFAIDIGAKGEDNLTGLGYLTYLSEEEFENGFLDLPDLE